MLCKYFMWPLSPKIETTKRSLVKTISWRVLAGVDTFLISYIITGKLTASAGIVGFEALTKMVWYYLHERGWSHIQWGQSSWKFPFLGAKAGSFSWRNLFKK